MPQRLVSRIHAGSVRQSDFLKVVEVSVRVDTLKLTAVQSFTKIQSVVESLSLVAQQFESASVGGLLRTAPDLEKNLEHIRSMYSVEKDGECCVLG